MRSTGQETASVSEIPQNNNSCFNEFDTINLLLNLLIHTKTNPQKQIKTPAEIIYLCIYDSKNPNTF